jgi:hypothetical protein
VDLKPFAGAAVIKDAKVLFAIAKGDISYVVVGLAGPTLASGGLGHCGAGEEENLVWLKVSHADVLDVRSVRVASCAFTIEALDEPTPGPKGLTLEYESYSERQRYTLGFDAAAPEKGLSISAAPLK